MRAYFFGNMYLSQIQQGIQALHVTSEMFMKYPNNCEQRRYLIDWAAHHKTVILCNAGYSSEIESLKKFFTLPDNPYPWSLFREAHDALCGALTCIGIVLPEYIYDRTNLKFETDCSAQPIFGSEVLSLSSNILFNGVVSHVKTLPLVGDDTNEVRTRLTAKDIEIAVRIYQYKLA